MDRSKLSNVISITHLLPHFTSTNIDVIKSCIFEQLDIENESQFVCIALNSIYKTLSSQSIAIIKNKAMEIAGKQRIQHDNLFQSSITTAQIKSTSPLKQQNNTTVYKYIQKQHNDPLSKLHSDIIDYFGAFLNEKESIEFGYLNKQLFIETQKQYYLLKRCNDKTFVLDDEKMDKLFIGKNDAFNYTYPNYMTVNLYKFGKSTTQNLSYFGNFFRQLRKLQCHSLMSLSCVPFKLLFKDHRHNKSNETINIEQLSVIIEEPQVEDTPIELDIICQEFDKWKNDIPSVKTNSNQINCNVNINTFFLQFLPNEEDTVKIKTKHLVGEQLLTRFGRLSKFIHLCNVQLELRSIDVLKSIFHDGLTHIHFDDSSIIFDCHMHDANNGININMSNSSNNHEKQERSVVITKEDSNVAIDHHEVGMLKHITFNTDSPKNTMITTFNSLDKFSIRKNIRCCTLKWRQPFCWLMGFGLVTLEIGEGVGIFDHDKKFFKDYDKHPLLEKIIIKFSDNCHLFGLARLLLCFNQQYKKLFVERKLYLKRFKTIELQFDHLY